MSLIIIRVLLAVPFLMALYQPGQAAPCGAIFANSPPMRAAREQVMRGPPTTKDRVVLTRRPRGTGDKTGCPGDALDQVVIQVRDTLAAGGIVVLGEVHDNPAHHRLRAEMLKAVIPLLERRPALVLEHLREDQTATIDRLNMSIASSETIAPTAADVLAKLDWSSSGWPAARIFEPLFEAAIVLRLPVVAGDAARGRVRDVARQGQPALAGDTLAPVLSASPLPLTHAEALAGELAESHCGVMPKTAFGKMALAQRYRDAHLARAARAARERFGSAVVLTGNGHARDDRGIPFYLRAADIGRPLLSIAIVERTKNDAPDHPPRAPDGMLAADFVITTARHPRPDPCVEMRRMMERRAKQKP